MPFTENLITEKFKKDAHFKQENSFVKEFENSPTFWKNFLKKHDPENKLMR